MANIYEPMSGVGGRIDVRGRLGAGHPKPTSDPLI